MEKKTIGKFIAVLRKANGMTQKDLGDRLFVSDKTVSRWERDECDPELSLIPAIAEIFGITTDELLRGERNNPDTLEHQSDDDTIKQKKKSEKQFKTMLFGKKRRFDNLTLISIGISLLGLIVGMIINLGFSKGLIAFFVTSAFLLASVICQICFTSNVRITTDEDDDYRELIDAANTSFIQKSVAVYFVNIAIFAFCLPLVTVINGANFGLEFGSWLLYGITFAIIGTAAAYTIYRIFICPALISKKHLILNIQAKEQEEYKRKILIKLSLRCTAIALVLFIAMGIVNSIGSGGFARKRVLKTPDEFKIYMEASYGEMLEATEGWYYDENGVLTSYAPIVDENNPEPFKRYDVLLDKNGFLLCEYYYHSDMIASIKYSTDTDNRCPITVVTREAMREASNLVQNINTALRIAIVADVAMFAGIYIIKVTKKKN
ncbi:MAG: helix-turn-helix transcriptional regulator [Clostridia bacterium]|nr:helix-turn-helix transcriptional regulator [Clostridia bacterium]